MKPWTFALLVLTLIVSFSSLYAAGEITVEVVDDTGDADPPFLLVIGAPVSGTGTTTYPISIDKLGGKLAVADTTQNKTVVPRQISELASAGYQVLSPYSGQMREVRKFTVSSLGSGQFMVFRGLGGVFDKTARGLAKPPFIYRNNANPNPVTSNFRFDFCEITYNANVQSVADTTSIDQFAIPIQMDLFQGSGQFTKYSDATNRLTYYLDTPSMLNAFAGNPVMTGYQYDVDFSQAIYQAGESNPRAGWKPSDGLSKFLRILGPGKQAANPNGSPAPYPSFSSYLTALANANYQFKVSGNSSGSAYAYSGKVSSVSNGFLISLSGTTTPGPTVAGIPANANVTVLLPSVIQQATATAVLSNGTSGAITSLTLGKQGKGYTNPPQVIVTPASGGADVTAVINTQGEVTGFNIKDGGTFTKQDTVTIALSAPAGSLDAFIYGATISIDSFRVQGMDPSLDDKAKTNNVYGTIVGDALAALNFGYMQGIYGDEGAVWYGTLPNPIPFSKARMTDDGDYNPWAALFYNHSDGYGFAFSDRGGRPSPAIDLQSGQTIRITLLPDERLNAPIVSNDGATDATLSFTWPPVANATSYEVHVVSPPTASQMTTVTSSSAVLTLPAAGTPYTVEVVAVQDLGNGTKRYSDAQPVQAATTGTAPAADESTTVAFDFTLSWVPNFGVLSDYTLTINGALPTTSPNTWLVNAASTSGSNEYVLEISKTSGPLSGQLYQGVITVQTDVKTEATAVPVIDANGVPPGQITAMTITNPGSDYVPGGFGPNNGPPSFGPTVFVTSPTGAGADGFFANVSTSGEINSITKPNTQNSGYEAATTTVTMNPMFGIPAAELYENQQPLTPSASDPDATLFIKDSGHPLFLTIGIPFTPTPLKMLGTVSTPDSLTPFDFGQTLGGGWVAIQGLGVLHTGLYDENANEGWAYHREYGWLYLSYRSNKLTIQHRTVGFMATTLDWLPLVWHSPRWEVRRIQELFKESVAE